MRVRAPALTAALWLLLTVPATVRAQADSPATDGPSHARAHWLIAGGVALSGLSFVLAEAADDAYASYLEEFDSARLQEDYDRAVLLDRLGSGALLVGQAALAAGIYLRFVKRSSGDGRRSEVAPARLGAAPPAGDALPGARATRGAEPPGFAWIADPVSPRLGIAYRF